MARVFVNPGERRRVHAEVLAAVQTLGDDYWALAELNMNGANLDWLILRHNPLPGRTATVIGTELKCVDAELYGSWDGEWQENRNGQWVPMKRSNPLDINPMQQAKRASDAFAGWMRSKYPDFLPPTHTPGSGERLRCYPMVLIHSPNVTAPHNIPRPERAYGMIFYSIEKWLEKIKSWNSDRNQSFAFTDAELERMVSTMQSRSLIEPWDAPVRKPTSGKPMLRPEPAPPPRGSDVPPDPAPSVPGILTEQEQTIKPDACSTASSDADKTAPVGPSAVQDSQATQPLEHDARMPSANAAPWMAAIEERLSNLEQRVAELSARPPRRPKSQPAPSTTRRPLQPEERDALLSAMREIIAGYKRRDFPTVVSMMEKHLGYALPDHSYNGFGKAHAFFDQAVEERLIKYGPMKGPSPTIFLNHETLPTRTGPDETYW